MCSSFPREPYFVIEVSTDLKESLIPSVTEVERKLWRSLVSLPARSRSFTSGGSGSYPVEL